MKFLIELTKSFLLLIILSIILCFIYPMVVYVISNLFFHNKANGSLIVKDKKIIGSKLIGQKFTSPYYFHGRPSIVDYDGINSSSSNFGPTSQDLFNSIEKNAKLYRSTNIINFDTSIPIDAITYSASGLDPHITYQNALMQGARIAKSRNISIDQIILLIKKNTENRTFLSRARINVLKLNLDLDENFPLKNR